MTPHDLLGTFWSIFGLVFGSFLNVVVYRLPLGLSTVHPGSRCPRCLMPVQPWHNLPVISYLLLGARCAHCKGAISVRYPLVEASTGLWFWVCYARLGGTIEWVSASFFGALLLVLALIDWDRRLVPQLLTWPAIAASVLLAPHLPWTDVGASLWGVGAALAGGWLVDRTARGFGSDQAFGAGDAQTLALVGGYLGWREMVISFTLAAMAVILWAGCLVVLGRARFDLKVPFVTVLAAAAASVFAVRILGLGL